MAKNFEIAKTKIVHVNFLKGYEGYI